MALLFGKTVAERLYNDIQKRIAASGITPGIGVILVGDDPASHLYVGLKEKAAERIGIFFEKKLFSENATFQDIVSAIEELNKRTDIHGILIQLPLPAGLPTDEIISCIDPRKDTDGFHKETIRSFLMGDLDRCPVFPRAIVEMLRETKIKFSGEKGLVITNSLLMGKVMVQALLCEGVKSEFVLSTEDKTKLKEKALQAKVIVTACGIPGFITGDMVEEGVIIIDGGIEHVDHKVVGDVDQESVSKKAAFLSAVPGGVGPVTVATLLTRVTDAALKEGSKIDGSPLI